MGGGNKSRNAVDDSLRQSGLDYFEYVACFSVFRSLIALAEFPASMVTSLQPRTPPRPGWRARFPPQDMGYFDGISQGRKDSQFGCLE